jgi:hypothetical protein
MSLIDETKVLQFPIQFNSLARIRIPGYGAPVTRFPSGQAWVKI